MTREEIREALYRLVFLTVFSIMAIGAVSLGLCLGQWILSW